MKKFVFSAAALTLTGTAVANDDWAQLDQDIQALSASVTGLEEHGMHIGGRIRAIYQSSSDRPGSLNDLGVADAADLGGFSVRNARLYASGTTAGDIGYRIEVDFANGGTLDRDGNDDGTPDDPVYGEAAIGLLDAYLDIPVGGAISARVGQFRAHVSRDALIDSGNLFFIERSAIGNHFAGRSQGAAISADFGEFDLAFTVQNGADELGDELFYALRGAMDLMGGGTGLIEGAYGAGDEMKASAAISYFSDEEFDNADGFLVEASLATGGFSLQASILDLGDEVSYSNEFQENAQTSMALQADTTPFSLQGTFMLSEASSEYGAWELGVRFQDFDNKSTDTDPNPDYTQVDIGANYYANGHDFKYIINWSSLSSDLDDGDVDTFSVGVNARF